VASDRTRAGDDGPTVAGVVTGVAESAAVLVAEPGSVVVLHDVREIDETGTAGGRRALAIHAGVPGRAIAREGATATPAVPDVTVRAEHDGKILAVHVGTVQEVHGVVVQAVQSSEGRSAIEG
jgi:hypothetical protein